MNKEKRLINSHAAHEASGSMPGRALGLVLRGGGRRHAYPHSSGDTAGDRYDYRGIVNWGLDQRTQCWPYRDLFFMVTGTSTKSCPKRIFSEHMVLRWLAIGIFRIS